LKKSGFKSSVGDLLGDLKKSKSKDIGYKPFDTVRSSKQSTKPQKNPEKSVSIASQPAPKLMVPEPTTNTKVETQVPVNPLITDAPKKSLETDKKKLSTGKGTLEKNKQKTLFDKEMKRDSSSQSNPRSDRLRTTQKPSLFDKPSMTDKKELSLQKSGLLEPDMNLNNISKIPESNQELFEDENSQVMSGLENMFKSNTGTKARTTNKKVAKKPSIHLETSKPKTSSKTPSLKNLNSLGGLFDRKKENTIQFKSHDSVKSQSKQSSLVSPPPKNIFESKLGPKKLSVKSSTSSAAKFIAPQKVQTHKRDSSLKSLMSSKKKTSSNLPKHRSEANIHSANQTSKSIAFPQRKLQGYQLQSISEKSAYTKPKERSSVIPGLVKLPASKPMNLDLKRSKAPGQSILKKKLENNLARPKRSEEVTSSVSRYTSESARTGGLRNSLSNAKLNVLKSFDKPKFKLDRTKDDFRSNLSGQKASRSKGSIPMPKLTVSPVKQDMRKNAGKSQGSSNLKDLFASEKKLQPKLKGITTKQSELKKIVGKIDLPKKPSSSIGSTSNPLFSARKSRPEGGVSSRRVKIGSNQSSLANLRQRDHGLNKQSAPNLTTHLLQSSSVGKLQGDSSTQKRSIPIAEQEIKTETIPIIDKV
jgi:hypothetical protein